MKHIIRTGLVVLSLGTTPAAADTIYIPAAKYSVAGPIEYVVNWLLGDEHPGERQWHEFPAVHSRAECAKAIAPDDDWRGIVDWKCTAYVRKGY